MQGVQSFRFFRGSGLQGKEKEREKEKEKEKEKEMENEKEGEKNKEKNNEEETVFVRKLDVKSMRTKLKQQSTNIYQRYLKHTIPDN